MACSDEETAIEASLVGILHVGAFEQPLGRAKIESGIEPSSIANGVSHWIGKRLRLKGIVGDDCRTE